MILSLPYIYYIHSIYSVLYTQSLVLKSSNLKKNITFYFINYKTLIFSMELTIPALRVD